MYVCRISQPMLRYFSFQRAGDQRDNETVRGPYRSSPEPDDQLYDFGDDDGAHADPRLPGVAAGNLVLGERGGLHSRLLFLGDHVSFGRCRAPPVPRILHVRFFSDFFPRGTTSFMAASFSFPW